jgi:serine/threonine-protein kinase
MLSTGQILNNRYRIVRKIAEGGFGAIYRAWDLNLGIGCALKENIETTVAAQRQFLLEANVLATLRHPNLPRVTDYFTVANMGQFLVMDFIEGENLQEKISKNGYIPELQALKWIDQVLDAMVYLHHQKPPVIHRDIKPQNIIITAIEEAQKVSLVDFGISKVFDPSLKTTIGARAVTPPYSPQEQYGKGKTDARSDIYALGATLFVSLTGTEPVESIQRTMGTDLVFPRQINKNISPLVENIVLKAMEPLPANRYQSAEVFQTDVKRAINNASNFKISNQAHSGKNEQFQSISPTYRVPLNVPAIPSIDPGSGNKKIAKKHSAMWKIWVILGGIILFLVAGIILGISQYKAFRSKNVQLTSHQQTLYFVSTVEKNKHEIFKYSDIGDPIRMTFSPGDSESWDPVFSPSGILFFVSNRDGQLEIYKKSPEGKVERLTYTSGAESSFDPTFTPDGTLYFCSTRDGGLGHIYSMSVDGKVYKLTYGTEDSIDADPVVSPEGTLYFVSNRDGNWDIYKMTIDGETKKVTHTKDQDYCIYPSFSSTGKLFASCYVGGMMDVYEVNMINGSLKQMTFSPGGTSSFASTFTGQDDLYFISDRAGGTDIYKMDKAGSVTRVTENNEALMPAFSND